MKIQIAFADHEQGNAEELLSAVRTILDGPLKVKSTPPRDGFRHIYVATQISAKP